MNSKIKKLIVGLLTITAVVAYPLVSNSKQSNETRIVLTADNTVNLNGEINDQSVADTIQALYKLDRKSKAPIYLFIYSPGGSIQAGFELIEAIRGMDRPVDAVTLFGASMAWQIGQSTNERFVLKNGILMSHKAAGQFEGSFGGQPPSQVDSRYGFWIQRTRELDQQTVARTKGKQTLESYQRAYNSEMWLTGSQAVDQGYADAIATVHCDKSLNATDTKQAEFMGFKISYEVSRCPLITAPLNAKAADAGKSDPRLVEEVISKFLDKANLEKSVQ